MSRFCVSDEKKCAAKENKICVITDAEIQAVVKEACKGTNEDGKKPTTNDLYDRISDLEFELECLRADAQETRNKQQAVRRLMNVVDLNRFEEKNKGYIKAIIKKILQIIS